MESKYVNQYIEKIKNDCFDYQYMDDIVCEGDSSKEIAMGIISDIHMHPINPRQVERTVEAINYFADLGVDLIFIDGDLTQTGAEIEYAEWKKVLKKIDTKDSLLHISMGNHELARRDTKDLFIKYYHELPDVHYKINGYHVIKLSPDGDIHVSDYSKVSPWLEKHLAIAKEDTGDLPIFVFFHHPVKDTYYSTREEDGYWGDLDKSIFDDYPMAITFSGHNHAPSNHPLAVWQGRYTAVNVPSMYYAEGPMGIGKTTYYEETYNAAQGIYLEAKGTHVKIRVYDFASQSYAPQVFEFDTSRPEEFKYTEGRGDQSVAPVFAENSQIQAVAEKDGVNISFTQAEIAGNNELQDIVYAYRFVVTDSASQIVRDYLEWSHWLAIPMPETFETKIEELESGQTYHLAIYPLNAFKKEGEPIEIDLKV